MNLACKNAILRRDVAHLIFPDEVQTLEAPEDPEPGGPGAGSPRSTSTRRRSRWRLPPELLRGSKRPVIIVGHGAREQMAPITLLAERLGAPVITTFKAKGQIADSHPLAAGVLGRSGTPVASWFMNESDLLLVMGASFSNHTGIYSGKPIIQVDFDPMQLGKFHSVEVPVWGEIGVVAESLIDVASGGPLHRRPGGAASRALEHLARGEGQPRRRRPRQRGQLGLDLRRPRAPDRSRGGDRRRCRQQHLLLRPLLRVRAPGGADERLPRLDRLRLPGGDRRLGRDRRRAPDRRRHRRRRLRPVHGGDPHRGQARDEHHPPAA